MSERPRTRPKTDDPFFDEKRAWSWVKDAILGTYLTPYLEKVKRRGEEILIIDPFAGPGKFKSGEPGSPLIITGIAEKVVPGRYKAIFGNLEKDQHEDLTTLLKALIVRGAVETYNLPAEDLLEKVGGTIGRQTVFLYLDPYGLPPEFRSLRWFLDRQK
jgi:three-Cys-motif partner protein